MFATVRIMAQRIPFSVRRGAGAEPGNLAPARGSVTGIGDHGQRILRTPDGRVIDLPTEPPAAIVTPSPYLPKVD